MRDIELAKKMLDEKNLTLCIVKDNKVIFKSRNKGVEPLYHISTHDKEIYENASLADRVTGKAAAIICRELGFKEITTEVISETAFHILKDINPEYRKKVPYIKNRNKDDKCPVERLSENIEDFDVLIERVKEFLKKMRTLKRR